MSLIEALKKRSVFRVAVFYLVSSWVKEHRRRFEKVGKGDVYREQYNQAIYA